VGSLSLRVVLKDCKACDDCDEIPCTCEFDLSLCCSLLRFLHCLLFSFGVSVNTFIGGILCCMGTTNPAISFILFCGQADDRCPWELHVLQNLAVFVFLY
jgi:hypothetical protein